MTLTMIKTRDLSWQDRTMNIEVMLAPSRNQLLMNKHKTLDSKCSDIKRGFDKERDFVLKNFVAEKRIMERKKKTFVKRKADIMNKRSSFTSIERFQLPNSTSYGTRGYSAPARMVGQKPGSSQDSKLFLTEVMSEPVRKMVSRSVTSGDTRSLKTESPITIDIVMPSADTPSVHDGGKSVSQFSLSSRRVVSPFGSKRSSNRVKSVRFDDRSIVKVESERPVSYGSNPRESTDGRVKTFVQQQIIFNDRPPVTFGYKAPRKAGVSYSAPLVANKSKSLALDKQALESAFDSFCEDKSQEGYEKLVRMATKMKTNVRLARNQSIVPTVAAFKCSKVFKSMLSKGETTS